MKLLNISAKVLLMLTLAGGALTLSANTPSPRGHAYGYYLRDGAYVLFSYSLEDGTRLITLSHCRPGAKYIIEYSPDVLNWSPLVVLHPQTGETAYYLHTAVMAKCFYRVIPVK